MEWYQTFDFFDWLLFGIAAVWLIGVLIVFIAVDRKNLDDYD